MEMQFSPFLLTTFGNLHLQKTARARDPYADHYRDLPHSHISILFPVPLSHNPLCLNISDPVSPDTFQALGSPIVGHVHQLL